MYMGVGGIDFASISTIVQLNFGIVPKVWYVSLTKYYYVKDVCFC
jgi:hypothetical protein